MQKILPMMLALGVCGEAKGHVVVVRVDLGMVWGAVHVGNMSGA